MALHCINTNSKEFKNLLKDTNFNSIKLSANIAEWQKKANTDKFPTAEQITDFIPTKQSDDLNKVTKLALSYNITSTGYFNDKIDWITLRNKLRRIPGFDLKQTSNKRGWYITRNGKKYIPNFNKASDDLNINTNSAQDNRVNYNLISIDILSSDKAKQVFAKGKKNNWNLNKILTELQIPKEQKQLILDKKVNDREEIITSLLADNSFVVEINIGKESLRYSSKKDLAKTRLEDLNSIEFLYNRNLTEEEKKEKKEIENKLKNNEYSTIQPTKPTQYYSDLTVPGGVNYTENEIATPGITPNIKGHAQFSTDNGIGWFRSDEQLINIKDKKAFSQESDIQLELLYEDFKDNYPNQDFGTLKEFKKNYKSQKADKTKNRRILEIQSDLFQKGRGKDLLVKSEKFEEEEARTEEFTGEERDIYLKELEKKEGTTKDNQFLQLLNKKNNWVTFFVKSIIQDSAKKGYEKVLFPKGNTAAEIEQFDKILEKLEEYDKSISKVQNYKKENFTNVDSEGLSEGVNRYSNGNVKIVGETFEKAKENKINQLKEQRRHYEGTEKKRLNVIEFYENTITNILKKNGYNPVEITDKYGHIWNEVLITEEHTENVKLSEDLNIDTDSAEIREHTNKLLSNIAFTHYEKLKSLDLADFKNEVKSIKSEILKDYKANIDYYIEEGDIDETQAEVAKTILAQLQTDNSKLWNSFVNYFSAVYKFTITDPNSLIEENGFDEIPQLYDDSKQLTLNRTDNIATKIKMKLSSIIDDANEITGLPEIVEYDKLLNRLINAHINDVTKEDFINTLKTIEDSEYPNLDEFIEELENSEDLLNAYITSLNYDMAIVYNIVVNKEGKYNRFDTLIQNRNSFVSKLDYDKWIDNINNNIKGNNINYIYDNVIAVYNRLNLPKNIEAASQITTNSFVSIPFNHDLKVEGLDKTNNQFYDKFDNDNISHLTQLSLLLNDIGIDISDTALINLYDKYKEQHNKSKFIKDVLEPIKYIIADIGLQIGNKTKPGFNYATYTEERATIHKLATIHATYSSTRSMLDYLDVNNNVNYTPIYHSYLSKLFKGLDNTSNVYNSFEPFTNDIKFKYSNLLFGDNAIFTHKGKELNKEITGINTEFIKKLNYGFFNGIKDLTSNLGLKYSELIGSNWDLIRFLAYRENMYFIPSSDSSRIATLNMDLGITNTTNGITISDKGISINTKSKGFRKVKNTILQELAEMKKFSNMFFTVDKNGNLKTKPGIINKLKTKGHPLKHWNGKQVISGGYPTGKVFQFNNLTYTTTENGKTITHSLNDILNDTDHLTETEISNETDAKINEFIINALKENINKQIESFSSINDTIKNYIKEDRTGRDVQTLASEHKLKSDQAIKNEIANYYINDYIAQVEIANFVNGSINEYKGQLDYNKRIGQSIKNGQITLVNTKYSVLHAVDIERNTPLANLLKGINPDIKKHYTEEGATTVSDGISFITLEEFERRSNNYGRLEHYADIIEKHKNPDSELDITEHNRFIESQKYFYYGRDLDNTLDPNNPEVLSKQYKDSVIVLSPLSTKGTQLEAVYRYMKQNDVDQISFKTAAKNGDINTVQLFDKNGNFNPEITDYDTINSYKNYSKHSNLVVQLDLPSHATNHTNKLGVQLEKAIFTNIDPNENYYIAGQKVKGEYIRKHAHSLIAANLKQSAYELLDEFGAIENNQIKYNTNGYIDIDTTRLINYLKDYVRNNETNVALNDILGTENTTGDTNLPLYNGLTMDKFTSILLAMFTKRVVNQRISGTHAALVPEIGLNPKDLSLLKPDKIYEYKEQDKSIDWIDEIYDDIHDGKRKDFKLQINTSHDKDGNLVHIAEVVVSPYFSKFYRSGELIDINNISDDARTTFGIRIPTEGKQSTVYAKVVGFLKTGASQVIAPSEFVTKTGWDFDIDTLYMYMKEVQYNKDGKFESIPYLDKDSDLQNRYDTYINNTKKAAKIKAKYHNKYKAISEKIHEKYKEIDNILINNTKLTKSSFSEGVDYLFDQYAYRYTLYNIKTELKLGIRDDENINSIQEDIDKTTNIIERIENRLGFTKNEIKDIHERVKSARAAIRVSFKEEFNKIDDELQAELEEQVSINEFSNWSIEEQNIRKARNNRLIDIFGSIVSNPNHINEYYKPNAMDHVAAVSKYINGLWGYNLEGINIMNPFEASIFRDLNMSVRHLKGNSVAWDGIMNVFSQLGIKSSQPITYNIEKDKLKGITKEKLEKSFDQVLDAGNKYIITTYGLATDDKGNINDIFGNKITDQSSEVTANILDAVSQIMGFNINTDTLGVFKLLSGTAIATKFNGENNHFEIPYLFTHQPAIVEFTKEFNKAKINNINARKGNVFNDIRNKYFLNILKTYIDEFSNNLEGGNKHPIVYAINMAYSNNTKLNIHEDFRDDFNTIYKRIISENFGAAYDIDTIPSITELENNIKQYQNIDSLSDKDKAKYYYKQLGIIDKFIYYSNISDTIVAAISTFNTDKLGTGPTFNVNRNLDENILNMYIDREDLNFKLSNHDNGKAIFLALDKIINSTDNLNTKLIDIEALLNSNNIRINSKLTGLTGENIIKLIYPALFNDNIESHLNEGAYTTFQNYYYYGNFSAMSSFAQLFPYEHGKVYSIKKSILGNLIKDARASKVFNNYINTITTNNMEFFRTTDNEALLDEINKELSNSNLNLDPAKYTLHRIKHKVFELSTGVDKYTDINSDLYINTSNPTSEDLRKFNLLSLADRILLIKSSKLFEGNWKNKYHGNHILDNIKTDEKQRYNKKSYFSFAVSNSVTQAYTMDSIKHIMEETATDNPIFNSMLKSTISDMIRNHYWLGGISFSSNISKYIHIDLLHNIKQYNESTEQQETTSIADTPDTYKFGMYDYANKLYILNDQNDAEALLQSININTAFHKANWNNNKIVPLSKLKPIVFTNNIQNPDWNNPYNHIIKVHSNKLAGTRYNKQFIVSIINDKKVLYKAYNLGKEGNIYYYPINKTLPNEVNETGVNEYYTLPIKVNNQEVVIRDENIYENIIKKELGLDVHDDAKEYNKEDINDTTTDNTKQSEELVSYDYTSNKRTIFTGDKIKYLKSLKDQYNNSFQQILKNLQYSGGLY